MRSSPFIYLSAVTIFLKYLSGGGGDGGGSSSGSYLLLLLHFKCHMNSKFMGTKSA